MKNTNETTDSLLIGYEHVSMSDMVGIISDMTDRNCHSEAREHAAAWLMRNYDSKRTDPTKNVFWATHEALRRIRCLHDWAGSITMPMLKLREAIWNATVEAADGIGEPYATAAHKLDQAM